jgi:hypothetical protein
VVIGTRRHIRVISGDKVIGGVITMMVKNGFVVVGEEDDEKIH